MGVGQGCVLFWVWDGIHMWILGQIIDCIDIISEFQEHKQVVAPMRHNRTNQHYNLNETTMGSHDYENTYRKRIRKTLGNEDTHQKIQWNTSVANLAPSFHSPQKRKPQPQTSVAAIEMDKILQQNKRLREQIQALRSLLLDSSIPPKPQPQAPLAKKQPQHQKQRQHLKKLIQKSYYSLNQMQTQIKQLKQQLSKANSSSRMLQKKIKILEFQNAQLVNKINNSGLVHRQEIQMLQDRIRKLDVYIGQLVDMIEQEQKNWVTHMQELNGLKKFYSSRNYR